jgi:hypothetical protein
MNSELAKLDHAVVAYLDRDQTRRGLDQGPVGRPGSAVTVLLEWKKGLRRAATGTCRRRSPHLSGKPQVRDNVYGRAISCRSDGMVHGATTALEDTEYLFFCDGQSCSSTKTVTGFRG